MVRSGRATNGYQRRGSDPPRLGVKMHDRCQRRRLGQRAPAIQHVNCVFNYAGDVAEFAPFGKKGGDGHLVGGVERGRCAAAVPHSRLGQPQAGEAHVVRGLER